MDTFTSADPSHEALRGALEAIQERFNDPALSLHILAAEQGISERHLTRLFKQHLSRTFRQYLRAVRIRAATVLLANCGYRIKRVAGMVGYSYSSHFGKDFRQLMNCTPAEFRRLRTERGIFGPRVVTEITMSDL